MSLPRRLSTGINRLCHVVMSTPTFPPAIYICLMVKVCLCSSSVLFLKYLFLFISNILILLQATIIPSSELQKQSDIQFPLLQDLGLEFDLFHLSPISLCFISATCYRVCHYPASCSLALWVRSAHIWYMVNIC